MGGSNLEKLGYGFNNDGKLRKLTDEGKPGDEPYKFDISDNVAECRRHYEAVARAVQEYIYEILEKQEHLERLKVPTDGRSNTSTFVFTSKEYGKKETLLVLIHGSGAVRAGQWTRRIIMNNGLEQGSQIPDIKKALAKGYGILVMNTNDNTNASGDTIRGSGTAIEHGLYVWRNYIANTEVKNVVIITHSYGGIVVSKIASQETKGFKERVKAVAFSDAMIELRSETMEFFKQVSRNWVTANHPLDTVISENDEEEITRVCAGTTEHDLCPYSARESIFKFLEEKLNQNSAS